MSNHPQSLFRQEVLAARADTSAGPALHIRPVGASRLTLFFAAIATLVLLVLIFGSYTKKERVQGVVQARDGVAMVTPLEAGLIKRVMVTEGQAVKAGEVLAEISSERYTDAGNTQALIESNLQSQRDQVVHQAEGQAQANEASLAALAQRMAQAQRDATTLSEEIRLQTQQIGSARKLLDQLQPLLAEHIVSEVQYEQQHQALLEQTARLQTLQRQRSAAQADLALARDEQTRLSAQHRVTRAGLDRDLLTLQQEVVQRRGARVTLLKAPVDGIVSGLLASAGQVTPAGATLASIVPSRSPMEAVLYVPSTAIGFIKAGQNVRVSYDAFPYQRFGQYHGTVRSVSQTDIQVAGGQGNNNQDRRAVFLVHVTLDSSQVKAYGAQVALHPGHTLTADVELDRRRLIRWMLDPVFAFSGKL
ncbi:MAG: HlyD family efflux transporter periplasmic adaptor subunit [Burkholderiales bacterium]|nr:HlyD family efflux transporter periplasmic adaptor subunit [Burkholderiales bacterium]